MNNIKILDCTLRDGGYINDWNFGDKKAKSIIKYLLQSNIDFIEIGFLKDCKNTSNKTLFNNVDDTLRVLENDKNKDKLTLMINGLEYNSKNLYDVSKSPIKNIRLTYKKSIEKEALQQLEIIISKGYRVFVNPTYIDQYSDREIIETINKINKIKPFCFSMVDTLGVLKESDVSRLYYLIENNLDTEIALDFHSHNNLQLSFSNAQALINICKKRELIIDSTVFGMGRGAGNLCSELLVKYLNDKYENNYDIIPILKIIDEQINPIFALNPWGYSVPYYLAAVNHCHPNYARYLTNKQTTPVEVVNKILKNIPDNKKITYDENLIKQLYLDNFSNKIDDTISQNKIKEMIKNKKVLLLSSGKSIALQKDKINEFIKKENPFVISLNFSCDCYKNDLIFITNLKRFSSIDKFSSPLAITSNIQNIPDSALVLNYSSYLNNSLLFDNNALMMLKLLIKLGVKEVYSAGLDGYCKNINENYFLDEFITSTSYREYKQINKIMIEMINNFKKEININFITKSIYN